MYPVSRCFSTGSCSRSRCGHDSTRQICFSNDLLLAIMKPYQRDQQAGGQSSDVMHHGYQDSLQMHQKCGSDCMLFPEWAISPYKTRDAAGSGQDHIENPALPPKCAAADPCTRVKPRLHWQDVLEAHTVPAHSVTAFRCRVDRLQ